MKNVSNKAPDWLRKSAVYQVYPRYFSPEGTISAVTKELPKLKELGFKTMYLVPVFEEDTSTDLTNWSARQKGSETNNPKNPYRMNNYFNIDSEYGTAEDLKDFVNTAHELGMRVLLDLVYLHIGPNASILKTHPEFAKQNPDGSFICTDWNFPYLDFNCQGLREYLWCNMVYFIGEFDVDGFRCDVGDGVPNDFWMEGRRRIKAIKPDAVLINEGNKYYRVATAFDSCYNFNWHENLYKLFKGELSLPDFIEFEKNTLSKVPDKGLLLRDMDNHDTASDWPKRVELLIGHDGMELVQALNYTFVGIPMVFNGNELADSAYYNLFANRFFKGKYDVMNRADIENNESSIRRQNIFKKLNELKAYNEAIIDGDFEFIENSCPDSVISFKRKHNGKTVVFIGNLSEKEVSLKLDSDIKNAKSLLDNNVCVNKDNLEFKKYGYSIFEL